LRLTLNKRLKGGKQATVIYQFKGSESALEALAKALKTHCGVGGSAKDGEVILQGNVLKPAQEYLHSKGYKFKLAGV
jgi:translation initiation factor 1